MKQIDDRGTIICQDCGKPDNISMWAIDQGKPVVVCIKCYLAKYDPLLKEKPEWTP